MGIEHYEGRYIIIDLLFRERRKHSAPILQYFPRCDYSRKDGVSLP